MRVIFFVVAVSIALIGCASSDQLTLIADESQTALTRDGVPALLSNKKHVVMLRPVSRAIDSGSRPSFVIAVNNRSKKPTDLRINRITASLISSEGKTADLHVYGYDELVAEEKRRQRWAAVGVALQGVASSMSAASAGYSRTHGTYSGNTYGTYSGGLNGTYSGSTYGTYSSTTYDAGRAHAAQQTANAQTAASIANLRATGQRNLAALQNTVLKDNTVMPGEWIGGRVILDSPKQSRNGRANYKIDVEFGGEVHSFNVLQSRTG